jgi:hypothetical protein
MFNNSLAWAGVLEPDYEGRLVMKFGRQYAAIQVRILAWRISDLKSFELWPNT